MTHRAPRASAGPAIVGSPAIDRMILVLSGCDADSTIATSGRHVLVTLCGGTATVAKVAASSNAVVSTQSVSVSSGWASVAGSIAGLDATGWPIVVRLGAGEALLRTITLPKSVADVVEPVLRNQIGQYTPWPEDAVAFGHAVLPGPGGDNNETITVRLAAADAGALDALLAAMTEVGLSPAAIEAGDDCQGNRPIVIRRLDTVVPLRARIVAGMLAAALAGTIVIGGLGWSSWLGKAEERAAIETTITRLASQIRDLASRRASEDRTSPPARLLLDRRRASEPAVLVMERLTAALPDTAWVEALTLSGDTVTINGRARDAAAVVTALEATGAGFARVSFTAPTMQDPDTGLQSFAITGHVIHRASAEQRP